MTRFSVAEGEALAGGCFDGAMPFSGDMVPDLAGGGAAVPDFVGGCWAKTSEHSKPSTSTVEMIDFMKPPRTRESGSLLHHTHKAGTEASTLSSNLADKYTFGTDSST